MARSYGSGRVTPVQRGHFDPMTRDGAWAAPYADPGPPESVENAHDQQNAPTHLLDGAVNSNRTSGVGSVPVADRAAPSDER